MAAESTDGQRGVLVVSWGFSHYVCWYAKRTETPQSTTWWWHNSGAETDFLTPHLHQV